MSKVIIFGLKEMAEIAHYYLTNDSDHEVVAFCEYKENLQGNERFLTLPVIAFETVEKMYPIDEYKFFAPMNSEQMNTVREKVYYAIKEKGYAMITYISSKATIYTDDIGDNCFIQSGNIFHPFTKIGNNVMMWSFNLVAHHGVVKDHVTFASHVAMADNCVIGENSYLGTNSTLRNGIVLAKGTLVGLATTISRNTEEWSVYLGNPAKKIGNNISKSILKI
ncbi:acetyltransferase [Xanthomarina sp.]|uniref:acetyltransferase n=1 Tax=Xanthomarina sp. TaxID=1931211 RepID=UPI002C880CE8|nr:acetyltransferase [Xanthomarina sp.]HLV39808.1 acetyltransferase [Xanthomarina sp.]